MSNSSEEEQKGTKTRFKTNTERGCCLVSGQTAFIAAEAAGARTDLPVEPRQVGRHVEPLAAARDGTGDEFDVMHRGIKAASRRRTHGKRHLPSDRCHPRRLHHHRDGTPHEPSIAKSALCTQKQITGTHGHTRAHRQAHYHTPWSKQGCSETRSAPVRGSPPGTPARQTCQ